MASKIPRNRDQGEQRDRVGVLSNAMLLSLSDLKAREDRPVYIVSSSNLFQVPGVIKDSVHAEPAVTARLDNIEKMVENLAKGFNDMKAAKHEQWPAIQVNGAPVQAGQDGRQQHQLGARERTTTGGAAAVRGRSPSLKRSADEAELQEGEGNPPAKEPAWNDVDKGRGRKPRPVQYGTAKVNVAGGEATG